MANSIVKQIARFDTQYSAPLGGLGVYIGNGGRPVEIQNLGFAVFDATGYVYTWPGIVGRIAAVLGLYQGPNGSPDFFTLTSGPLNAGVPLMDVVYNSFGGLLSFIGKSALTSDRGEGITFLMSTPVVTGTGGTAGYQPVVSLFGTTGAAGGQGSGAASAAAGGGDRRAYPGESRHGGGGGF